MRIEMATEPASPNQPNEDFVGATPSGVVLLDGAGAAGLDTGCIHGVAWFARQLGAQILCRLDDHERELADILADAIDATAGLHQPTCDLAHPGTPSATVVIVRTLDDDIDYLVLADSVLVLAAHDGTVEAITDDRETRIGRDLRSDMDSTAHGTPEHEAAVLAYVRALQAHRNIPGGFWVAASNPAAAREAFMGQRASRNVATATVLSDGASRLVDRFGLATWSELISVLDDRGPNELICRVRAAESSDPAGRRWPRGKSYDDATVAVVTFQHHANEPINGTES
jgi:hypothetical protein